MHAKAALKASSPRFGTASMRPAAANDWVKKTCAQRETLTIAGFALDGSKWDGLYLGRRRGSHLIYAGKVDHGFDSESAPSCSVLASRR